MKLDWDATFRVWVRKNGRTPQRQAPGETIDRTFVDAYESGMREILGDAAPALAWSGEDIKALTLAIRGHGQRRRDGTPRPPEKLPAWVRGAAADFAEALRENPSEAKFYSDGSARGLLRWLNRDALEQEARRVGS